MSTWCWRFNLVPVHRSSRRPRTKKSVYWRYAIVSEAEYERQQFEAMDRRMPYMLKKTQDQLIRALKRGDFEAIKLMCADTGLIGRLMEHQLTKVAGSPPRGTAQTPGSVGIIEVEGMADEVREASRQLLQLTRKALPEMAASLKVPVYEPRNGNGYC